jgi:hypothetical protein
MLLIGPHGTHSIDVNSKEEFIEEMEKMATGQSTEEQSESILELDQPSESRKLIEKLNKVKEMTKEERNEAYDEVMQKDKEICERYGVFRYEVKDFIRVLLDTFKSVHERNDQDLTIDEKMKALEMFLNPFGHIEVIKDTPEGQVIIEDLGFVISGVLSEMLAAEMKEIAENFSPSDKKESEEKVKYLNQLLVDSKNIMLLCRGFFDVHHHMKTADCENNCELFQNSDDCILHKAWENYQNRLQGQA